MGFRDGHRKYNPEVEGYGNPHRWKKAFYDRIPVDEAAKILSEKDPWVILELEPGASQGDIKKSYRRLMLKWHPDRNPDRIDLATEMSKLINAAYSLLYVN